MDRGKVFFVCYFLFINDSNFFVGEAGRPSPFWWVFVIIIIFFVWYFFLLLGLGFFCFGFCVGYGTYVCLCFMCFSFMCICNYLAVFFGYAFCFYSGFLGFIFV